MKKILSVLIIVLLCLSILSLVSPKARAIEDPDLVSLPAGCKLPDPSNTALDATRLLISISIKGQGQTATVSPEETVSATCTYRIYSGAGNPNEINQGFFILSWTPSWPAPSGYSIPIWNGISGVYPGVTNTASFTFTAPSTSGTYYLYWCGGAEYTMADAVNRYNQPLVNPAQAKIIVGAAPATTTLTVTTFDESGFAPASANGFQRLAEVKVKIYAAGGGLVASDRSGDDGTVTFSLNPGVYTVQYGGCLYRSTSVSQSSDLAHYGACLPDSKQVTVAEGSNQLNLYVAGLLFHEYQWGSDGGDPFQLDYVDLNSATADHETAITVSPGQAVQAVASFWELETINVPVWLASVFGDWNPTAALANLASGVASPSSHTLHTVPFTFTAPTQPGPYHIRLNGALDYDWCNSFYTGGHPNPHLGRDMGNNIISNLNIDTQTREITGIYGTATITVAQPSPSSELLSLPAEPYGVPYQLLTDPTNQLVSLSEQVIDANPGQTFSLTLTYKIASPNNPSEIDQLYFVESWTPSWPPNGYTITVYNGIPGTSGFTDTKTVSFTAPSQSGTYYLWFCFGAQYTMQDQINLMTTSMNGLPAHVKIVVSNPSTNSPVNLWLLSVAVGFGIVATVFGFTALHYHNKASAPKQGNASPKSSMSKDQRVCPNCGASLPMDSRFCRKCGTALE